MILLVGGVLIFGEVQGPSRSGSAADRAAGPGAWGVLEAGTGVDPEEDGGQVDDEQGEDEPDQFH